MTNKNKRRVNPIRVVIIILSILVLGLIIFFTCKLLINDFNIVKIFKETEAVYSDSEKKENEDSPIQIDVIDYRVYVDDNCGLGFNFVLANLKFTSNEDTIDYDLNNLLTSERIPLGSISDFEEKLISSGFDLNKLGYSTTIHNEQGNSVETTIFIPYQNKIGELCVYDGEVLKFDISSNTLNASSLKLSDEVQKTVVESKEYTLTVFDAYIEDFVLKNGAPAVYPSTIDVYTFIIDVDDISSNTLVIEEAKYMPNNSNEEIEALDSEYSSSSFENIIDKSLKKGDRYVLLFPITNPTGSKADFGGKVLIKFENSTTWLEINAKNS